MLRDVKVQIRSVIMSKFVLVWCSPHDLINFFLSILANKANRVNYKILHVSKENLLEWKELAKWEWVGLVNIFAVVEGIGHKFGGNW